LTDTETYQYSDKGITKGMAKLLNVAYRTVCQEAGPSTSGMLALAKGTPPKQTDQ